MGRPKKLILKKDDQSSPLIQSIHLRSLNRLRLARTDTAVYHTNQARHHDPHIPTYNHTKRERKRNILLPAK